MFQTEMTFMAVGDESVHFGCPVVSPDFSSAESVEMMDVELSSALPDFLAHPASVFVPNPHELPSVLPAGYRVTVSVDIIFIETLPAQKKFPSRGSRRTGFAAEITGVSSEKIYKTIGTRFPVGSVGEQNCSLSTITHHASTIPQSRNTSHSHLPTVGVS